MTDLCFYIFIFIFGAIIGSFLNVLILRYNTGVPVTRGRSFCFSCGKKLTWIELIPIFSFIFQKGKCLGCKSHISWQYPLVEALTGLLFVSVFLKFGGWTSLYYDTWFILLDLILMSVLVFVTVYDIRHKIIPDVLVVIFGILALVKIALEFFLVNNFYADTTHLVWSLLAGPILALPLFLIWLISRGQWMGLGDPKLVLCIGWFLGPVYGLSAVVLGFWSGAIYGLVLMFLSKLNLFNLKIDRKSELPFAPFLILGFLLVFYFSFDIFNLGLFLS